MLPLPQELEELTTLVESRRAAAGRDAADLAALREKSAEMDGLRAELAGLRAGGGGAGGVDAAAAQELEEKNAMLLDEVEKLSQEMDEVDDELEAAMTAKRELEEQVGELEAELDETVGEVEVLLEYKQQHQAGGAPASQPPASDAELAALRSQLVELQASLDDATSLRAADTAAKAGLQHDNEVMQAKLMSLQASLAAADDGTGSAAATAASAASVAAATAEKVGLLEAEVAELEAELDQVRSPAASQPRFRLCLDCLSVWSILSVCHRFGTPARSCGLGCSKESRVRVSGRHLQTLTSLEKERAKAPAGGSGRRRSGDQRLEAEVTALRLTVQQLQ
eukprot:SAG22_NODE_4135_length_1372_cov_1.344069_1_plen_337_part_10